jgi:hypothetical protein
LVYRYPLTHFHGMTCRSQEAIPHPLSARSIRIVPALCDH